MGKKKQEKLSSYLKRRAISMNAFANELGVTREAVRAWCAGEYEPKLHHIQKIEKLTDGCVTATSFEKYKKLYKTMQWCV